MTGKWRRLHNGDLHDYHSGDQIKKNEMGEACGTYGEEKNCVQGFGWGDLRERDHLEDAGVDGRVILRWISKWLEERGLD